MQADLMVMGLPHTCVAILQALAQGVAEGGLLLDRGADREQTTAQLLALPGVEPWTASYIAMRAG